MSSKLGRRPPDLRFSAVAIAGLVFAAVLASVRSSAQLVEVIPADTVINFIVVGDWGHRGEQFQKPVADQMAATADSTSVDFIISTGDNFYPDGVVSIDDPMWQRSFENVFTHPSMQVKWYPVLGNHDYHVDPQAQVDYTFVSPRWRMPSRYYALRFMIGGDSTQEALFIFLDTNPLVPAYHHGTRHKVRREDRRPQLEWLKKVLSHCSNARWKIVVAHHPMYTGGGRRYFHETWPVRHALKRLLKKSGCQVYLAGHEHSLQYLGPIHGTHHFISGAGATKTKARKIFRSRFAASAYGFMLFALRRSSITTKVIDHRGAVLYQVTFSNNGRGRS